MFHTDDEFLAAVERSPAERTVRLAYADWLDEQGDSRAELIRVEEEMRALPAFADRFWQLKPRRNELRVAAGADWCGRMRYGTEAEPVFRHGIPDGWRERWRLIREFTERWHRRPMPDVGGRHTEVAEAESRLGRTLSPSVREWVAYAYDMQTSYYWHPYLHAQHYDAVCEQHESLLVSLEDEWYQGVPYVEFGNADPSVYNFLPQDGQGDELTRTTRESDTLSAWVLGRTVPGSGTLGCVWVPVAEPSQLVRDVETTFSSRARLGDTDFFEMDNLIVTLSPDRPGTGTWLRIDAYHPITREQIPAFLWEYVATVRNGGAWFGIFDPEDRPQWHGGTDEEPIPF